MKSLATLLAWAVPIVTAECMTSACGSCARQVSSSELEPGAVEVRLQGETLQLRAKNAERRRVLEALAERVHFSIVDRAPLAGEVSLELDGVTLPAALAAIIHAVPYAVHYPAGGDQRWRAPIKIELGAPVTPPVAEPIKCANVEAAAGKADEEAPTHAAHVVAEVDRTTDLRGTSRGPADASAAAPAARLATRSPRARSLASEAPEEREHAVSITPPVGTGSRELRRVLAGDSAPQVRIAAARQLGGSADYASTNALLSALRDSDPGVVAAAAESLVDIGDPSVCGAIRTMLEDDDVDPSTRQALKQAIDSLEYSPRILHDSPDVMEYQPAPKGTPVPQGAEDDSAGAGG